MPDAVIAAELDLTVHSGTGLVAKDGGIFTKKPLFAGFFNRFDKRRKENYFSSPS